MEHARPTTRIHSLNVLLLIALFGLMSLFAACGSTAQPPPLPSSMDVLAKALAAPGDSMHVRDSTYQRITTLFDANFNLGTGKPIQLREQELAWTDLADLIPPRTGHLHALQFDFGLEADSMQFGISVLELDSTADPQRFNFKLPDSLFVLKKGVLNAHLATHWRKNAQYDTGNPAVYFSKVQVRHKAGDPFGLVDHDEDTNAEVMAWDDELLLLKTENASGHGDSTFFAVLRCISKPDDGGALRHRVCIHLRLRPKGKSTGPYRDLLDNSFDKVHLFRMHGADFGNMCPPPIDWYGLPPR